jgi:hypothetical protein
MRSHEPRRFDPRDGGIGRPGRSDVSKRAIDTAVEIHEVSPTAVGGSDKAFGLVLGAFFAILAFYPLIKSLPLRWWALLPATLFVLAALIRPRVLAPLNRLWTKLGVVLNRIFSPVALLVVYCVAVVPTGLLLRVLGKDPLKLRADPKATSYWIQRTPPGRADEQMKRQF